MINILKKFEKEIYKFTKHSHIAWWQGLLFKHSHEAFPLGETFWVVYLVENYTFATQKEIQGEYYHSDQVSMHVHVLYRYVE